MISSQWSKFVAESLGCTHNILVTVMTDIIIDKSTDHCPFVKVPLCYKDQKKLTHCRPLGSLANLKLLVTIQYLIGFSEVKHTPPSEQRNPVMNVHSMNDV